MCGVWWWNVAKSVRQNYIFWWFCLRRIRELSWAKIHNRQIARIGEIFYKTSLQKVLVSSWLKLFIMYFLRPFSLVPLAVESTQLTLWHSSIWQINPWELLDSKRHQPLLNVNSFRLKCWFVAKDPGWKWRTVGKCNVVHVVIWHVNTPKLNKYYVVKSEWWTKKGSD